MPRLSITNIGSTHMLLVRLGLSRPGAVVKHLHRELCHAHEKHPHFADSVSHGLNLLGEEFGEACKAYNEGDKQNTVAELAQVNAVVVRLMDLLPEEIAEGEE